MPKTGVTAELGQGVQDLSGRGESFRKDRSPQSPDLVVLYAENDPRHRRAFRAAGIGLHPLYPRVGVGERGLDVRILRLPLRRGVYRSDYTLPVIITYLAAYAAGIAVYAFAWSAGSRWIAGTGMALSIVGLMSFGIEGSHWLWSHNLSRIASFPVVMFPLAVVAGYQFRKAASSNPRN